MKIRLHTLALQCKKSREVIEFARQVTFFHGGIGAGKSSIARLIDYCLGGDLEQTQALSKEMVSVELTAQIERYTVIFERQAGASNQVQVTWQGGEREVGNVLAPLKASDIPIWDDDVYNLSDLIFYLFGTKPLKVRKNKQDEDSKLIRLSFRDIMWYCYLQQESLDSSFYRLKEPITQSKSRDVMRFVVGYYSERLNDLDIALERATSERLTKIETSQQIRNFVHELGYSEPRDVAEEIEQTANSLEDARAQQSRVREGYRNETHFADRLRQQLRKLSERLGQEEQILADLQERLEHNEALKAEVVTARFKLARAKSASAVLSGVEFQSCPACGNNIDPPDAADPSRCPLCHSRTHGIGDDASAQSESVKRDLESRI